MKEYNDFKTLLKDMENDVKIVNGLIDYNYKTYYIKRKINNNWE